MKKAYLIFFAVAFMLSGCSNISNKPIFEKLSADELSKAIKSDAQFADFYTLVRDEADKLSDIKKATYKDITYRRLFKYVKFTEDSLYWNPMQEKWKNEWENVYGIYMVKADSVINHWKKYLEENSLDKYVEIDLARINKEYYTYSYDLKEVHLGFRLTPLQGTIEQIHFNYRYKPKINQTYTRQNCISTSPFPSPIIKYWEVSYSERDNFAGENVETFLRDYDLIIEVTRIRKDGVNIDKSDFNIPEVVSDYLLFGETLDFMKEYYKEKIIKEQIYKGYLKQREYYEEQADVIKEKRDKRCYNFVKDL
jgi:hypothetical protein